MKGIFGIWIRLLVQDHDLVLISGTAEFVEIGMAFWMCGSLFGGD